MRSLTPAGLATRAALVAVALLGLAFTADAQTARVQVIHNAPDPGAAVVDVYLDEAILLDDFEFRTASAYIDAPAGQEIEIDIAPGDSDDSGDAIATFNYTLAEGEAYQLIASGVLDPMMFSDNPDGVDIAFTLLVNDQAQESSTVPSEVQFNVVHGSPDAPTVDVVARGVGTLVDDAAYTAITPYLSVPPARYVLDVTTADGQTVVATYVAPLEDAAGAALTVLASGFLTPDDDQNGPAFGLLAVAPDGTAMLLPTNTAQVQVIHNAPDPGAAVVDVYLNEEILLDDFAFRTASPFVPVPAEEEIEIDIAPGNSTGSGDAIATFNYTLAAAEEYQLIASGVLDPTMFAPNPDGVSTAFTLLVNDQARSASESSDVVRVSGVHGSPDAPSVDAVVRDVLVLVDDAVYTDITRYRRTPPGVYNLDILTADGSTLVASYVADVSGAGGEARSLLASGFLDPSQNQNGPAFGILSVAPDGSAMLLPEARVSAGASATINGSGLAAPQPNPTRAAASLALTVAAAQPVEVAVYDVTGRRVAVLLDRTVDAGETVALSLDASALPAGVYVVRAQGEDFAQAQRVTVLR
ncbi:MAG: DUF4397 domain-containing protein [Rubricoccaceae bacterium]|nr:DUF4397 domain-containing protein [Rubricoccaceae bacterium]